MYPSDYMLYRLTNCHYVDTLLLFFENVLVAICTSDSPNIWNKIQDNVVDTDINMAKTLYKDIKMHMQSTG